MHFLPRIEYLNTWHQKQDKYPENTPSKIKHNLNLILKKPAHQQNRNQNNYRGNHSFYYIIKLLPEIFIASTDLW